MEEAVKQTFVKDACIRFTKNCCTPNIIVQKSATLYRYSMLLHTVVSYSLSTL